jgi:hypothetical protein
VLSLLSSPHLIDIVLAFTFIEGVVLAMWFRRGYRTSRLQRSECARPAHGPTGRPSPTTAGSAVPTSNSRHGSARPGHVPRQAAGIGGPEEPNHDGGWGETASTRVGIAGKRARPPPYFEVCIMLLPGVCLMLAVRAALVGAIWPWVPIALSGALIAHLFDLRVRWRG